jgi:outer membrane protein assembly factor BamB
VLGLDGEILIGDTRGRFRALRAADGTIAWTVRDLGSVRGTATVAPDGTIFVGTEGGQLLALDSRNQGKERFRVEARAGIVTAPAIAPNGDVYWAALDNELRRMNSRGDIVWQKVVDGEIRGAPSIGPDGTVYVGAGGSIVAVDGGSGAVKWRASAGDTVGTTPVIGPDGSVYAGAENGRFVAVSASGATRWTYQTGAPITGSAAVSSDGVVYVGSGDATMYAFSPDGERLSTFRALDAFAGPVAIGPGGVVFAGARDNRLYALRDDVRTAATSPGDRLAGDVVRDPGDGRVFVVVDGQRRYIPDATTQGLLGLTTPVPRNLNSAELARYPEGPALPALAEGMAIRASNGPLYVIRDGKRSWLRTADEAATSGANLDQAQTLEDRVMRSLTLDLVDGMLVKASGERVYLFGGGQWHWLSSGAALAARGDWSQVHLIADNACAVLPEGDAIA